MLYERFECKIYEVVVLLIDEKVVFWTHIEGV